MIKQIKCVLALAAMMIVGNANAQYQIANSSFDEWETVTGNGVTAEEPVHWNSFLTAASGGYYSTIAKNQLEKATGRSGKGYSAKLTARNVLASIYAQGNLTTGQINGGSMSASDANGNYNFTNVSDPNHNMPFTGRPDAVKVWVKFNGGVSKYPYGKVSVFLHGNGYYQDPNTGNTNKLTDCVAQAYTTVSNCDWTELTVPFTYSNTNVPTYVLASFSTNAEPGQGTASDYLYVDDMQMVYYSDIKSAVFNGTPITFNGTSATVNGDYKEKFLKITSGAGAKIEYNFNKETYLLTVTIKGDNFSEDPTNYHVYTIQFSGVASDSDDESGVVVTPETVSSTAPAAGWFYIRNKATGNFVSTGSIASTPHRWYVSAGNDATIKDANGYYIKISAGITTHSVTTSATQKDVNILFNSPDGFAGYYQVYGKYAGLMSTYYTYFYDNSGKNGAASSASTADSYLWEFIDADLYDRVNGFWKNYTKATTSNGIDASAFIKHNASNGVDAQTITGLPLGLYKLGNGSIQYLASGSELSVPANTSSLTYYGRLDLTPIAKYNGVAVENNKVDAAYYADKLTIAYGNGAQSHNVYYDEETRIATVEVKGYGRSRETAIQFAAPDTKLNATYMGTKIESEGSVDEEYVESNLKVTYGDGIASHTTSFDDNTGVLTITLTDIFGKTTEHTVNFLPTTPATISTVDYKDAIVCTLNGAKVADAPNGNYVQIATLANGNISVSIKNLTLYGNNFGDITAQNIQLSADGRFLFKGERRLGTKYGKRPILFNGQIKDGLLCGKFTMTFESDVFVLASHMTVADSKAYNEDLLVSVNGSTTDPQKADITVETLETGNINFVLRNFILGDSQPVGNITMDNLSIDAEGNFSFDGKVSIASGDYNADWLGPKIGELDLTMRGTLDEANQSLVAILNIVLPGQNVHVALGATPASSRQFTDNVSVSVNGQAPTVVADSKVTVGTLANGNINFTLNNFYLGDQGVGNISIENLALDAEGNFAYNGDIMITKGTSEADSYEWLGASLGFITLDMHGKMLGDGMTAVIDIAIPEQNIHVTFGATPSSTQDFVDDVTVCVNGQSPTIIADNRVTVGYLANGNINFTLNNFYLADEGVGNISIENLALDAEGNFAYNGNIMITQGTSEADSYEWLGTKLGFIPVDLRGTMRNGGMSVVIDIVIPEQNIHVTFGATNTTDKSYTEDIAVVINGSDPMVQKDQNVVVGTLKNGNINFSLKNFYLEGAGVGNISVENLSLDSNGSFSYKGGILITTGTSEADSYEWLGPKLGFVPVDMQGIVSGGKMYVTITIELPGQSVQVEVGEYFEPTPTVAQLANLIEGLKAGRNTKSEVENMVNKIIGK